MSTALIQQEFLIKYDCLDRCQNAFLILDPRMSCDKASTSHLIRWILAYGRRITICLSSICSCFQPFCLGHLGLRNRLASRFPNQDDQDRMAQNRTIQKWGHASDRRLRKPLHFMENCLLAGHTHTSKLWQFGRQFVGNSKQFGTFSGNSGCSKCSERATRGNSGPEYFAFYKINKRADDVENLRTRTWKPRAFLEFYYAAFLEFYTSSFPKNLLSALLLAPSNIKRILPLSESDR